MISRELRNGEPLFTEFDGGRQDLLHGQLSATKSLDRVNPAGSGSGDSHGMHTAHGDLARGSLGDLEALAICLEGVLATSTTRAIESRYFASRCIVIQTKHVTANAG